MQQIKKGDKFKCIETVIMKPHGEIGYVKGNVYSSENNECITDEGGNKSHFWDVDELFHKHFEKVEEKNLEYLEARGLNKQECYQDLEQAVIQNKIDDKITHDFKVDIPFELKPGQATFDLPEKVLKAKGLYRGSEGYEPTSNSTIKEFIDDGNWFKLQDEASSIRKFKSVYRGTDGEWHELPEPNERKTASTAELIITQCDELKELLLEKNRKYGDSALKSGIAFNLPATVAIKARINDKLARLKNDNQDEDEDIVKDLLGYFILLRIAQKQEKENKDEELRLEHGII